MKKTSFKKKIFVTVFVLAMVLSLTACAKQEDVDSAVKPLSAKITTINETLDEMQVLDTTLDGYIDALESAVSELEGTVSELEGTVSELEGTVTELEGTVSELEGTVTELEGTVTALQAQAEQNAGKFEELEKRLNCLEDKHELVDCEYNNDDTHTGTCINCSKAFVKDCVWSDWSDNEDGTKSKTCTVCNHTVVERINVTITLKENVNLTIYWEDDLTVDLAALLDITEGAGDVTYTLTTSTGSIDGSILSCPLVSDYEITVTTAETSTHNSAAFSFTVSVKSNPNTGGFDGEWITF